MPKKFKWDPGPVLLQDACTAGDAERVRAALEQQHVPVDACTNCAVPFCDVLPGMLLSVVPHGKQVPYHASVVSKSDDAVQLLWNPPQKQGPPQAFGGVAFSREGEEGREWWDAGSEAKHVLADNRFGCTGLHCAAAHGRIGIVKYLLSKGADVNRCSSGDSDDPDGGGHTPLMCAAHNGHQDVVEVLLDSGADPTALNAAFRSATDYARDAGHNCIANKLERITEPLLTAADVPSAMRAGDVLWLKQSLQRGTVAWDWAGKDEETLLYLALQAAIRETGKESEGKCNRMLDFVLKNGAPGLDSLTLCDDPAMSVTPLMYAAHNGRADLIRLLLDYGADAEIVSPPDGGSTAIMLVPTDAAEAESVLALDHARRAVAAHLARKAELRGVGEEERKEWKRELKRLKQEVGAREAPSPVPPGPG
eukprot:TRINITY_DN12438_c0_g1_i1.p1 TRINITY_DN12438_c0_g1~~TRINITY_DN12438_c0_g1_i1.p1  ORF type:complete len:422 (+),score=148.80 TRINITY_DN12438_c0_g1_i1:64-1329(+)